MLLIAAITLFLSAVFMSFEVIRITMESPFRPPLIRALNNNSPCSLSLIFLNIVLLIGGFVILFIASWKWGLVALPAYWVTVLLWMAVWNKIINWTRWIE